MKRKRCTDRHPIPDCPKDVSDAHRIQFLEIMLAQLWDEVWWHQLPWWRRFYYWCQGFRSPIEKFYIEGEDGG